MQTVKKLIKKKKHTQEMQTVKPNGNWMTTSENDREAITQGPEMGPAKPQAAEGGTTARRSCAITSSSTAVTDRKWSGKFRIVTRRWKILLYSCSMKTAQKCSRKKAHEGGENNNKRTNAKNVFCFRQKPKTRSLKLTRSIEKMATSKLETNQWTTERVAEWINQKGLHR